MLGRVLEPPPQTQGLSPPCPAGTRWHQCPLPGLSGAISECVPSERWGILLLGKASMQNPFSFIHPCAASPSLPSFQLVSPWCDSSVPAPLSHLVTALSPPAPAEAPKEPFQQISPSEGGMGGIFASGETQSSCLRFSIAPGGISLPFPMNSGEQGELCLLLWLEFGSSGSLPPWLCEEQLLVL